MGPSQCAMICADCPGAMQSQHPSLLQNFHEFEAQAAGKRVAVFLDYDGVLPMFTKLSSNMCCHVLPRLPARNRCGRKVRMLRGAHEHTRHSSLDITNTSECVLLMLQGR